MLTRTFPPTVVDEVVAGCGRTELRNRSLPARAMAYFSIGMALHSEGSYEDVLGLLTDGLAWTSGDEPIALPSKSAIFQARSRLGSEPLQKLFSRVATPLAGAGTPGAWLGGRRLVAIDGTCLDVADTPENSAHFGRPGVNKGEQAAFPQARVVAVAECGTHAIFDAAVGKYTTAENTMAGEVIDRLTPGMLLLADRGFCGFPLWSRAVATGADLLWRAIGNMKPRPIETLADGSWLAELRPSGNAGRKATPLTIRVIDYRIDDGRHQRRALPALHHHPRSRRRLRSRPRCRLHPALGDREYLRRAEDPPARPSHRAAIEVAGPRAPRDLGSPLLPLRHPNPDVGGRRPSRGRPRPGQLRRRTPHRSPLDLSGARFFPLRPLTTAGDTPSRCSRGGSIRPVAIAATRESSSASTSSGT